MRDYVVEGVRVLPKAAVEVTGYGRAINVAKAMFKSGKYDFVRAVDVKTGEVAAAFGVASRVGGKFIGS